jgi:hypothetical protein
LGFSYHSLAGLAPQRRFFFGAVNVRNLRSEFLCQPWAYWGAAASSVEADQPLKVERRIAKGNQRMNGRKADVRER